MNAPDPFTQAPDWWLTQPWPLPEPMTAEQYQQEQIDTAKSAEAFDANAKEYGRE